MCAWHDWEADTICKSVLKRNKQIYKLIRTIFNSEILDTLDILNNNLAHYDDSDINLLPLDEERKTIIQRMKTTFLKRKFEYFWNNYGHILPKDCWNIIINQYDDVEACLLPSKTSFSAQSYGIKYFYKLYGNMSNLSQIIGVMILVLNPYFIDGYRLLICITLWLICLLHIFIGLMIYEIHFSHKYIGILHRCKTAMGNDVDYLDIELFEPFQEWCWMPLSWNVCIYHKTYSLYRKYKIISAKSANGLLWKYINVSIYLFYSIMHQLYGDTDGSIVFYECLFIIYTGCLLPVYFMWNNCIYYNHYSWYKNWYYFINGLFIGVILCIIIMDNYHEMPYYFKYVMYLPSIVCCMYCSIIHRFKVILFGIICIWYFCLLVIDTDSCVANDYLHYILFVSNEWIHCLFRLYVAIILFADLYFAHLWNHLKWIIVNKQILY